MIDLKLFFTIIAALIAHDVLHIGLSVILAKREQKKMKELQDKIAQDLKEGKVPEGLEYMFPGLPSQPMYPTASGEGLVMPHGQYL